MSRRLIPLVVLAAILAWPTPATAWHQCGHMTTARIAWQQLNDKERVQIAKILKAHPHYDIYLTAKRPRDLASEPEWAFVQSTIWADWVRDPNAPYLRDLAPRLDAAKSKAITKQFNKPVWHYVDLPFIHPRDVGKFDEAAIRKEILEPYYDDKGEPRHALAALEQSMKQLQNADTPDADKAVALCWLGHVAGDLHQPLHGCSLIASKETYDPPLSPPGGDQGGNLVIIRVKPSDTKFTKLHFFWDALLFGEDQSYAAVQALADKLLKDPKLQRNQLPELKARDFLAWAEESRELCKKVVYKDKDAMLKVQTVPPGKVDWAALDPPALPAGYAEAAEAAAARRMTIAGYRLADQIRIALKSRE